jgi:glycosyltransferase involved in cell wall biosynthesis
MKNKTEVIIFSNPFNHEGGIINYYKLYFNNFQSRHVKIVHMKIGSRMKFFYFKYLKVFLFGFYYLKDVFHYLIVLVSRKEIKIVQLSPSLIVVPIIRDSLPLIIAKIFNKKVIVFFRGWKLPFLNSIKNSKVKYYLFNLIFGSADRTFVLAKSFKKDLVDLGWNPERIFVTTTAIDKKFILKSENRIDNKKIKFIFLGRVSRLKGIHELVEAFSLVRSEFYDLELSIAGHPDSEMDIEKLKMDCKNIKSIENKIKFVGYLDGKKKYELLSGNDIYIFPSYSEGCPNSVLEALGSGLFIIGTKVGALADIIINKENGVFVAKKSVSDLIEKINWSIDHIKLIRERKKDISTDAIKKFDIRPITKQFENTYLSILDK